MIKIMKKRPNFYLISTVAPNWETLSLSPTISPIIIFTVNKQPSLGNTFYANNHNRSKNLILVVTDANPWKHQWKPEMTTVLIKFGLEAIVSKNIRPLWIDIRSSSSNGQKNVDNTNSVEIQTSKGKEGNRHWIYGEGRISGEGGFLIRVYEQLQ